RAPAHLQWPATGAQTKRPARRRVSRNADAAASRLMWQPRKDSNLRMPESESGALPLGDGAMARIVTPPRSGGVSAALTLGELRGAACLVQADLLALDFARIAGHEARLAQLDLQRLVVLDQRAGDAQADRTGLAGGAAAGGGDEDVEALGV